MTFFRLGKIFDVSLISRLIHNNDMLGIRYAIKLSRILYNKRGELNPYSKYRFDPNYVELVDSHNKRTRSTIKYWMNHNMIAVPEKYIREFIADQLSNLYSDNIKYLTFMRDLFFSDLDSSVYKDQIEEVYFKYILKERK